MASLPIRSFIQPKNAGFRVPAITGYHYGTLPLHQARTSDLSKGGGLRGPQGTPLLNQNSSDLAPIFWKGNHFTNEKKTKKFDLGPTQIAKGDRVTSKFRLHGLQRALFAPPLGSYVAPGAQGIQRICIGP